MRARGWIPFTIWLLVQFARYGKPAVIICRCGGIGDVLCTLPGLGGGASPASGEVAGLYHSASLARGRCDVSVRGFGLLESVVGTPVYISNERQFFRPRREDL